MKYTKAEDKPVVLTRQLQTDLRVVWKLLKDAFHKAAADRLF